MARLKVAHNQHCLVTLDHCRLSSVASSPRPTYPFPSGKAINYKNDGTAFIMHWRVVPVRVDGAVVFWLAIQREAGSI